MIKTSHSCKPSSVRESTVCTNEASHKAPHYFRHLKLIKSPGWEVTELQSQQLKNKTVQHLLVFRHSGTLFYSELIKNTLPSPIQINQLHSYQKEQSQHWKEQECAPSALSLSGTLQIHANHSYRMCKKENQNHMYKFQPCLSLFIITNPKSFSPVFLFLLFVKFNSKIRFKTKHLFNARALKLKSFQGMSWRSSSCSCITILFSLVPLSVGLFAAHAIFGYFQLFS